MRRRVQTQQARPKMTSGIPIKRAAVIRFQPDDKHGIREATALADAGFDVDLVMLRGDNNVLEGIDPRINVVLAPIRKKRGSAARYLFEYTAWFVFCFAWLSRESRQHDFDYVQVDSLPDHQVFCTLIPKMSGAKIGLFLKEPTRELCLTKTGSSLVAAVAGWIALRSIRFADVVFCVTEPHRQSYIRRGIDPSVLHVVLNSTPPFPEHSRSRLAGDGRFEVLCHGTIEKRYGHSTIVEAAALARHRLPGLSVHVPGRGTFVNTLRELVEAYDVADVVSLDGWLTEAELSQLLADADVGVVGQLANPYSHLVHTLKMYDYMMAGVAVVATRLEATESMFPNEISYFESGDAAGLADVWVELYNNPDRRLQQIVACRERLGELGWEVQMKYMVEAINASLPR